jgi:3-oxoacyl-[acyl-carrier protein] reductase
MDLGLKDRVAIVGGSSRGVGRAIAQAFVREGANVTVCALNDEALRRTEIELAGIASQHHVLAIPADLSIARDIRRVVRDTFNRFDQIGILVTHVGDSVIGPPSEFEDEAITTDLERNLFSAIRLSREVIPYLKQQHWGRIINLLSPPSLNAMEGLALSAASQMALMGYFKNLSIELAPFNITVNNVVAGPVATEHFASQMEREAELQDVSSGELLERTLATIPMGRLGKPEEVGDLVAFLASDRAGFVTGASVVADGGMFRGIS